MHQAGSMEAMSSSPVMIVAQRAWLAAVLILVYSWDVPGPGVKVIASVSSS